MKCHACCTAASYDLKHLFEKFRGQYETEHFEDVVHVEYPKNSNSEKAHVFFFPYGVIVCWNLVKEDLPTLFEEIKSFENHPSEEVDCEEYSYQYGEKAVFKDDEIALPDEEVLTKLAFSHGIAQSTKLGAFEDAIQSAFEQNRKLPEYLAQHGSIPLSRRQIRKKIGQLFIERSYINLHLDILDTPEFFWVHPDLEPLYPMIASELDLPARTTTLNQQLDVLRDMFEMLGNELNHQHSSQLEWAIILLIVIEVTILIFHDVLHFI